MASNHYNYKTTKKVKNKKKSVRYVSYVVLKSEDSRSVSYLGVLPEWIPQPSDFFNIVDSFPMHQPSSFFLKPCPWHILQLRVCLTCLQSGHHACKHASDHKYKFFTETKIQWWGGRCTVTPLRVSQKQLSKSVPACWSGWNNKSIF